MISSSQNRRRRRRRQKARNAARADAHFDDARVVSLSLSLFVQQKSVEEKREILSKNGTKTIVFDRAGRKYHGCVKTFAEALRSNKIKF